MKSYIMHDMHPLNGGHDHCPGAMRGSRFDRLCQEGGEHPCVRANVASMLIGQGVSLNALDGCVLRAALRHDSACVRSKRERRAKLVEIAA